MDFGLDKCAKITIKAGKRTSEDEFNMDGDTVRYTRPLNKRLL